VKYVPQKLDGMRYYQYTAIDCASRWRYLAVYPEQANEHSVQFLAEVIRRFPYPICAIKTDNHSTFTNAYTGTNRRSDRTVKTLHALDRFSAEHGIAHYLIDPGKPAQNGKVERSHRSDQESFYNRTSFRNLPNLKRQLRDWNTSYNNLEHCGLNGRTPAEYLLEYQLQNPLNVRT
jgi:transposase InsO family protein